MFWVLVVVGDYFGVVVGWEYGEGYRVN